MKGGATDPSTGSTKWVGPHVLVVGSLDACTDVMHFLGNKSVSVSYMPSITGDLLLDEAHKTSLARSYLRKRYESDESTVDSSRSSANRWLSFGRSKIGVKRRLIDGILKFRTDYMSRSEKRKFHRVVEARKTESIHRKGGRLVSWLSSGSDLSLRERDDMEWHPSFRQTEIDMVKDILTLLDTKENVMNLLNERTTNGTELRNVQVVQKFDELKRNIDTFGQIAAVFLMLPAKTVLQTEGLEFVAELMDHLEVFSDGSKPVVCFSKPMSDIGTQLPALNFEKAEVAFLHPIVSPNLKPTICNQIKLVSESPFPRMLDFSLRKLQEVGLSIFSTDGAKTQGLFNEVTKDLKSQEDSDVSVSSISTNRLDRLKRMSNVKPFPSISYLTPIWLAVKVSHFCQAGLSKLSHRVKRQKLVHRASTEIINSFGIKIPIKERLSFPEVNQIEQWIMENIGEKEFKKASTLQEIKDDRFLLSCLVEQGEQIHSPMDNCRKLLSVTSFAEQGSSMNDEAQTEERRKSEAFMAFLESPVKV